MRCVCNREVVERHLVLEVSLAVAARIAVVLASRFAT